MFDLILGAGSGSDGSGPSRATAAAGIAGRLFPTAARLGSSPDLAEVGLPGVKSTKVWLWGDIHDTRNLLAALAGLGEVCNSERGGDGWSARRNTPASACAST